MKILTAAQMREVDRRTIEMGIPGLILMENAGQRVVECLQQEYAPLERHRVAVFCGRGNNGGDGLVIARQLHTRFRPASLHVLLAGKPEDLQGDAAKNLRMLRACGSDVQFEITPEVQRATLIIDALLGTGLASPARGLAAEWIHAINTGFPEAKIVAVDLPSGLQSDSGSVAGEAVRAHLTVTFTAPKPCHVLSPACEQLGKLVVAQIGSPTSLYENDPAIQLALSGPAMFRRLFQPRVPDSNKGMYGHALIVAGGRGKTGAA
ncbi:MAG: NAD(P)H-hydrate epimerase, partial [Acidobacteriaceae bacterium]|nr:NAD(P)H-hydrate epimerase [Acidobacteriaceae bacterium]